MRTLRTAQGISLETLGDRSGLTSNYVGECELGKRNLSVRVLWQLADGLGMPASELLREAEKQQLVQSR